MGQAGLDAMSVIGIQNLSGVNVDVVSQAAPRSWNTQHGGSSKQLPLGKATTDAQLEALQTARARASTSLQTAARDTADEMAAANESLQKGTSDIVRQLALAGDGVPRELAAIAKPTTQLISQIVGFSSVIGSWIVSGSSQLVSGAFGVADLANNVSIGAAEAALNGVQTLMSAAQTQANMLKRKHILPLYRVNILEQ
jgi:hypothetical protein